MKESYLRVRAKSKKVEGPHINERTTKEREIDLRSRSGAQGILLLLFWKG